MVVIGQLDQTKMSRKTPERNSYKNFYIGPVKHQETLSLFIWQKSNHKLQYELA